MMKKLFVLSILAAVSALFAACSEESLPVPDENGGEKGGAYMKLDIRGTRAAETRADRPTGGEPGDGHEEGFDYENRIDNFMLIFYRGAERSNSPADTPVDKIMYFDRTDAAAGGGQLIRVNLPAGEYDLLVVANAGDMRPAFWGMTLGGIRDFLITRAWTEKGGSYSHFVMTSDGHTPDRVTLCGNPKEDPADAVVEVERVAARIDYRAARTEFAVDDPQYGRAKAALTGAVIVNRMKAGSYLLKRVASPDAGGRLPGNPAVGYLGDELPREGGVQRNYVVDPWSGLKTAANAGRKVFNPLAPGEGTRPASELYDNPRALFSRPAADWEKAVTAGTPAGEWMRLGYTLENTESREHQIDDYTTFVVFRVAYVPEGFEPGRTFYACDGRIYPTREAAAAATLAELNEGAIK
ncbi:MAG: hypothetical protein Q4E62_09110, partial [Sutterellaceae bacterium]|nr:hypothetical protein [Sutterellaceae bacterium]